MERTALATIDLAALRHNLSVAKQTAPDSQVMAVIKANAYGHGLLEVAEALSAADAFAVSCLEEAVALRGVTEKRIVVLQGFHSREQISLFSNHSLEPVIHQAWQVSALLDTPLSKAIAVSIKVDTGMHRLGINVDGVQTQVSALRACKYVRDIQLMTHMASADELDKDATTLQIASFNKLAEKYDFPCSMANSAALLGWPQSRVEWVRPGIMLYGVNPFIKGEGSDCGLKPAMTLSTRLIAVNECRKGDRIGYGGQWECPENMRIGIAAIGYGDGYPRHAVSGTPVLINGHRCHLVGRVSMDMLTLDLTGLPEAAVGDEVVLWGRGLPAEEIAIHSGTIAYELLCNVYGRVNYDYINKEG